MKEDNGLSTGAPCLNLLLVLTEFPPRIGGMQTHAANLAAELVARGHRVEVLTYRKSTRIEHRESAEHDAGLAYPVHRQLTRISHEHNLDVIESHVRRLRPDLVYASTVFYGEIQTRCDVPVVARSVGNDVLRPWIVYPFRPFARIVSTQWFEDRAYRFFRGLDYPERIEAVWRGARRKRMESSARRHSAILPNSSFTEGLLRDIGVKEQRLRRVVGGVDSAKFSPVLATRQHELRQKYDIPQDAWVMLTACRLVKKKGVDFLVNAMAAIQKAVPQAHLFVVGSGREHKRLQRLADASSVSSQITFAGRVPHPEVAELYGMANVFVLASRVWVDPATGLKDAETMGRVLCEANAAGLPVIAARSGGIPSVIEHNHNGLLFEPDDTGSLVEVVRSLRYDEALESDLVRVGQEFAKARFDWKHVVDAHEDVFLSLLLQETAAGGQATRDF